MQFDKHVGFSPVEYKHAAGLADSRVVGCPQLTHQLFAIAVESGAFAGLY
jgi:hypothetical protein